MKDTYILFTVIILIVVAISAVFVGYATDTLPTDTPRQIATAPIGNTAIKTKKGCSCCKERLAKFREFMEMRERKKATAQQDLEAADTVSK